MTMRGNFDVGGSRRFERVAVSSGVSTAPLQVWAAPSRVLVEQVVAYEDSGDPLVFNGGASELWVGTSFNSNTQPSLIQALKSLVNAGRVMGAGFRGPYGPGTAGGFPNATSGVVLIPAGGGDGTNPIATDRDGLYATADVGTITGTWFLEFFWTPMG